MLFTVSKLVEYLFNVLMNLFTKILQSIVTLLGFLMFQCVQFKLAKLDNALDIISLVQIAVYNNWRRYAFFKCFILEVFLSAASHT